MYRSQGVNKSSLMNPPNPPSPSALDAFNALFGANATTLRLLFDSMPERVSVIGLDLKFVYVNPTWLEMRTQPLEFYLGKHISEVHGKEIAGSYGPLLQTLMAGNAVRREEWVNDDLLGRRFVKLHLIPYRDGHGAVNAIIIAVSDATEAILSVEALRKSEALKSAIVDNALVGLISTDADGLIAEFNPTAERMFGCTRADVLGKPVSDVIIPARFRAGHLAGMQRLRDSGTPQVLGKRLEMSALRADGSEIPVEMVLWRTQTEGETFYTASLIDLTERQAAAEQIERQRDALRQSEKLSAMGSLLAGVAHELNNPLAIVMGRASLLEMKCADESLRSDVVSIREATERCGRIVRTFLNMARQKSSERKPTQLNNLITGALDLLQYSLRTSGLKVIQTLAPDLPEIVADSDQLGQVVLNLLVNAQQAMTGQPQATVTIATGTTAAHAETPAGVWMRLSDNGPGIPAAVRERVFDPFFTTKVEGSGTGLGLSVSRSIAREHSGDLLLEPSAHGASFLLTLPIGETAAADKAAPAAESSQLETARVLVVDDESELADLVRQALETAGYEVATAESGAVALEMLATARFDAVITDLRMPDIDGVTLWREIEQRYPALAPRVVFVTGDSLSAGTQQFFKDTRAVYVEKPFTVPTLLSAVQKILS